MAAGLGFKDFQAGSVLTAADTNGYLASQANMVFATAAARDAAIISPQEGMVAVLKDSDSVFMYSGTAWIESSGIGGYTSFTPTLTGWTVGNGTFTTLYKVLGKMVHYYGRFTFGSTSAVGGAGTNFNITLPFALKSGFGVPHLQLGQAQFRDVSLAISVVGGTAMNTLTSMDVQWFDTVLPSYVFKNAWNTATAGLPFTFVTGDFVTFDIVYERA